MNNVGYGTRESSVQVLNCHVYKHYLDKDFSVYDSIVNKEVIDSFKEYIHETKSSFVTYPSNNTSFMRQIITKNKIPIKIDFELRCGFSYITQSINCGVKPFIIGFSIKTEENENHQINKLSINKTMHNANVEISLIKYLHDKDLIDATFCSIIDTEKMKLDCSLIRPKEESLKLLTNLYNEVTLSGMAYAIPESDWSEKIKYE